VPSPPWAGSTERGESRHSDRDLWNDSVQNPEIRIFRFMVWALLMCLANQIAAHFAPDKLAFVRDVFVVLIFPMVLFPIRNKRPGDSPVGGSGTSPMPKIGIEKPVKLLWVEGNCPASMVARIRSSDRRASIA